ncbi:MAG: hypothetical protein AAF617_03280 [Bacteroidota bacterium]
MFCQVQEWQEKAAKLSDVDFANTIENLTTIAPSPKLSNIQSWKSDKLLTSASVYQEITTWNTYTQPKRTGVITKMDIMLQSQKVPVYIYIPTNYKSDRPTKLLIYYRGGWMSRKEYPENIAKEIVLENPTFSMLDKYNVIEVYPALKQDLAIYGMFGYAHLRKIVAATKKQLNIDDNKVYLAGFSDGGRTVLNIAYLAPTAYAAFFTINGTINNSNAYFPNFSNRKLVSFMAENDGIVDYRYMTSMAQKSQEWNADWILYMLKDKPHFYYPYASQILPVLFAHIKNSTRNPYPNTITYHKAYDYEEFTNIDWLGLKVNTKKTKEKWHYERATSIVLNKEKTDTFVYGENIAQVEAHYFNNTFTVKVSLVEEVDIYISPLMVNMTMPVVIQVNGKI